MVVKRVYGIVLAVALFAVLTLGSGCHGVAW